MLVKVSGCSERQQAVLFVIAGEASRRLYISVHMHSSTFNNSAFICDGQNRPMFCLQLVEK